jgi:N-acetylglucosaminyldiphosphoundecaprenol N-acetyl-beta-D-mannosaminyltransferase
LAQSDIPRGNILGIPVGALTMLQTLSTVDQWIAERQRRYVCTIDVHALMESHKACDLQEIYRRASLAVPDGMPLVWLLRRRGHPHAERLCGPDLMPALFALSERRGYRHFLYGSSPQTLGLLERALRDKFPRARVAGSFSPPFRPLTAEEKGEVNRLINRASPDIIWVGLGAPKQDRWMAEHRPDLEAPVLIGVGGAFEMMAGKVRRAPVIMRKTGCEWMFRLGQEPRRLARRYLGSHSAFILRLIEEKLRGQAGA